MMPVTSKNYLNNYYNCPDCNALYKLFNERTERCKYCGSDKIKLISEDQYYNEVVKKLEPDEIENSKKEREKESDMKMDLMNLDLFKKQKERRFNIN